MTTHKEWKSSNPLRKFRDKYNIPRTQFASYIGVSMNTVQFWEDGTNIPQYENFEKIAIAMEVNTDKLIAEWNDWIEHRPKLKGVK